MMWHFLLKNYKINLCNLIHNLVPIAINKGSHQTLEREREREFVQMDQVVKSLRNWARARARMADKRGRFQGSNKKDNVVAVIVDVDFVYYEMEWFPAPALTSSFSEYQWNGMTLFIMRWLLLACYVSNSTFLFLSPSKKKKKKTFTFLEREREMWKRTNLREE